MAKTKAVESVVSYELTLNAEEAGYLLDLLSAHVGGTLTLNQQPLGAIRVALEEADVERLHVSNSNYRSRYAVLNKD